MFDFQLITCLNPNVDQCSNPLPWDPLSFPYNIIDAALDEVCGLASSGSVGAARGTHNGTLGHSGALCLVALRRGMFNTSWLAAVRCVESARAAARWFRQFQGVASQPIAHHSPGCGGGSAPLAPALLPVPDALKERVLCVVSSSCYCRRRTELEVTRVSRFVGGDSIADLTLRVQRTRNDNC